MFAKKKTREPDCISVCACAFRLVGGGNAENTVWALLPSFPATGRNLLDCVIEFRVRKYKIPDAWS